MKRFLLGVALGAAGLLAAGSEARADGYWSVGLSFGGPVYGGGGCYRPAPVYCPPRPVYYGPPSRPIYYRPAPVHYYPRYRPIYPAPRHGYYGGHIRYRGGCD